MNFNTSSRILIGCSILLIFLLAGFAANPGAAPFKKGVARLADGILTDNNYAPITIGNVFNYYSNLGDGTFNPYSSDDEGFEFPTGTPGRVFFEDGVVWGGFSTKNDSLYVGGSTYWHGWQAGRILTPGSGSNLPVADDPTLSQYHVYRVRPDITPSTVFSNVQALLDSEQALIGRYQTVSAQQLYNQYVSDWNNWPAAEGAPYTDVNNDGVYEPSIDIPGIPGADQTLWFVANDLNSSRTATLAGSPPLGMEMQKTIWAYNRQNDSGNAIFISTTLINKSGYAIDSMFMCQWTDPDLGGAQGYNNNYVGCDTVRNLCYVYYGLGTDPYYGTQIPAAGFALVQGPIVPAGNGSSAKFEFGTRSGYKNLGMSAFQFFSNGNSMYVDPANGTYGGTIQWYNIMNGLSGVSGAQQINPVTGLPSKFLNSGDPATNQGWVDGLIVGPGDRRMVLVTGPVNMAPGDTQQIVVEQLAVRATDARSSVTALRLFLDSAQIYKLPPGPYPTTTSLTVGNHEVQGQELASQTYVPSSDFNLVGVNPGPSSSDVGLYVGNELVGGALGPDQVQVDVQIRFVAQGAGQNAYDYIRSLSGGSAAAPYSGFYPQPFTVYDVTDTLHPFQIDAVFMEAAGYPTQNDIWAPGPITSDREYLYFVDEHYTPTAKPEYAGSTMGPLLNTKPVEWAIWAILEDTTRPAYRSGDVWTIRASKNDFSHSSVNEPLKFVALVSDSTGNSPTGLVDFYDGNNLLATSSLTGTGASMRTSSKPADREPGRSIAWVSLPANYVDSIVPAGIHSFTARYRGDSLDLASVSTASLDTVTAFGGLGVVTKRNLPAEYKLEQNYPNPFNPTTTIYYALPKSSFVHLEVFNILGQHVSFDASALPSEMYFYRITAASFTDVKKMVLIK